MSNLLASMNVNFIPLSRGVALENLCLKEELFPTFLPKLAIDRNKKAIFIYLFYLLVVVVGTTVEGSFVFLSPFARNKAIIESKIARNTNTIE